jgi:L-alanine-DL-glutamate epimerase-like enolase superfamily enzyme
MIYPTRIRTISVFDLRLPLKRAYSVSGGRVYVDEMRSVIVGVETDDGLVGWGEGCPFGNAYLPAFAAGIHAGIAELAPLLLGENPLHPEQLSLTMDSLLAGHDYIKSALDMACWDLLGQAAGLPLYALLGGRFSDGVAMMGVCPNDAPEAMAAALDELRALGYRCFSPKVGGDLALDVARIRAVLDRLEPDETIVIDANRAWLPDQAVRIMLTRALAEAVQSL